MVPLWNHPIMDNRLLLIVDINEYYPLNSTERFPSESQHIQADHTVIITAYSIRLLDPRGSSPLIGGFVCNPSDPFR